jgi:hypothetical protein
MSAHVVVCRHKAMMSYCIKLEGNCSITSMNTIWILFLSLANVVGAKSIIKAAMVAWEKKTCIRFVKRTNQQAFLLIRRKKG